MANNVTEFDILVVNAGIDVNLLNNILHKVQNIKSKQLKFYLTTDGGDPHIAFKISKLLQDLYQDGYIQVVMGRCKSAGTLIACGAKAIEYVKHKGELGPLDVQKISVSDLQAKQVSALNLFKTIEYISNESAKLFQKNFMVFKSMGLGTKSASEVSCDIVKSIYEPICSQIEPNVIGEFARNLEISKHYMQSLNKKYNNLKGMDKLIYGYPDHNFVIDCDEALDLFLNVQSIDNEPISGYNNEQVYFKVYDSGNK
jgi:hypothetical protein